MRRGIVNCRGADIVKPTGVIIVMDNINVTYQQNTPPAQYVFLTQKQALEVLRCAPCMVELRWLVQYSDKLY